MDQWGTNWGTKQRISVINPRGIVTHILLFGTHEELTREFARLFVAELVSCGTCAQGSANAQALPLGCTLSCGPGLRLRLEWNGIVVVGPRPLFDAALRCLWLKWRHAECVASAVKFCFFNMFIWAQQTELGERASNFFWSACDRSQQPFRSHFGFAAEGVMARRSVSGRGKGKQLHLCRLCGGKDHRQETCPSFAGKKIRELQAQLKHLKAGSRKARLQRAANGWPRRRRAAVTSQLPGRRTAELQKDIPGGAEGQLRCACCVESLAESRLCGEAFFVFPLPLQETGAFEGFKSQPERVHLPALPRLPSVHECAVVQLLPRVEM